MSSEDIYSISRLDVPAAHRVVRRSGQKYLAVRVGRHASHRTGVLFEGVHRLTGLERPRHRRKVRRPGDENVAVQSCPVVVVVRPRYEGQRVDAALVTGEDPDALAGVEVPALGRAVVGAGEDEIAGADDAVDERLVTTKNEDAITGRHIPLSDRLVGAAADDVRVLDDETVDVVLVTSQYADAFAAVRLRRPQTDRAVVASGGEHRGVFAHRHRVNAALVLLERLKVEGFVLRTFLLRTKESHSEAVEVTTAETDAVPAATDAYQ